ncbi:hypothetical protein PsYK624_077060 [Phanerochaete sordida]|uniref:Uncharacterized protein n=1 Tax=Phanerochaete sordida TaxID=48140 RepID=A0A9P3LDI2_9APHY|nr:hypothetical protein PsYK624_077060 [Phanerochaete sordida]
MRGALEQARVLISAACQGYSNSLPCRLREEQDRHHVLQGLDLTTGATANVVDLALPNAHLLSIWKQKAVEEYKCSSSLHFGRSPLR